MTRNQLQYWADKETARSNLVNEAETQRSNLARENENFRHNRAMEELQSKTNLLTSMNIAETARANQAREMETHRANLESEKIRQFSAATDRMAATEVIRHNRASEDTNLLMANEQARSNLAREAETQRANKKSEELQKEHSFNALSQNVNNRKSIIETKRHNVATEVESRRSTNLNFGARIADSLLSAASRVGTALLR